MQVAVPLALVVAVAIVVALIRFARPTPPADPAVWHNEQMRARLEAQGVRYVRLSPGDAVPILAGIPDRELPAVEAVDEIDEARRLLKPLGYEPFVVLDGNLQAGVEPGPVFFLSRRNAAHFINFDWR